MVHGGGRARREHAGARVLRRPGGERSRGRPPRLVVLRGAARAGGVGARLPLRPAGPAVGVARVAGGVVRRLVPGAVVHAPCAGARRRGAGSGGSAAAPGPQRLHLPGVRPAGAAARRPDRPGGSRSRRAGEVPVSGGRRCDLRRRRAERRGAVPARRGHVRRRRRPLGHRDRAPGAARRRARPRPSSRRRAGGRRVQLRDGVRRAGEYRAPPVPPPELGRHELRRLRPGVRSEPRGPAAGLLRQ